MEYSYCCELYWYFNSYKYELKNSTSALCEVLVIETSSHPTSQPIRGLQVSCGRPACLLHVKVNHGDGASLRLPDSEQNFAQVTGPDCDNKRAERERCVLGVSVRFNFRRRWLDHVNGSCGFRLYCLGA